MQVTLSPLFVLSLASLLIALVLFSYGIAAMRFRRPLGAVSRLLTGLLLLSFATVFALIALATQGYRAFTQETLAATVSIDALGEQRFAARFEFPNGREVRFELAGDQLYVDAHILKWHPWANLMGLGTAFELDRVSGRYESLDDEQNAPRTVYSLKVDKPLDMYALARRYEMLAPLVDAEYGSATFLAVEDDGRYAILVSTSGLLARELPRATP